MILFPVSVNPLMHSLYACLIFCIFLYGWISCIWSVALSQKYETWKPLHYISIHYITLHYITLHYITLHYITLHYITLHYFLYIFWLICYLACEIIWLVESAPRNNSGLVIRLMPSACDMRVWVLGGTLHYGMPLKNITKSSLQLTVSLHTSLRSPPDEEDQLLAY